MAVKKLTKECIALFLRSKEWWRSQPRYNTLNIFICATTISMELVCAELHTIDKKYNHKQIITLYVGNWIEGKITKKKLIDEIYTLAHKYYSMWGLDEEKIIAQPIEQRNTGKGNPNAIIHRGVSLNNRQKELLEKLPEYDSSVTVPKNTVNMKDLSAFTAYLGVEFAMFTKGQERLIIRGGVKNVNVSSEYATELNSLGYRWSGHTHPGFDVNCMFASPGDYAILNCFEQEFSVIYNSKGNYNVFRKE